MICMGGKRRSYVASQTSHLVFQTPVKKKHLSKMFVTFYIQDTTIAYVIGLSNSPQGFFRALHPFKPASASLLLAVRALIVVSVFSDKTARRFEEIFFLSFKDSRTSLRYRWLVVTRFLPDFSLSNNREISRIKIFF